MLKLASSERGRCNTKGSDIAPTLAAPLYRYLPKNAGARWREREVRGRLAASEGTNLTSSIIKRSKSNA
jgi:hypothetical protein